MQLGVWMGFFIVLVFMLFGVGFIVYGLQFLYSAFAGAPYVSIKRESVQKIIRAIKKDVMGKRAVELGCGDGRFVRELVRQTSATGVGIDINMLVVFLANIRTPTALRPRLRFVRASIFDVDLCQYEVIYMFLLPPLLHKAAAKIRSERTKSTLIVSHGFLIHPFRKHLIKTIQTPPYKTYVYRLPTRRKKNK